MSLIGNITSMVKSLPQSFLNMGKNAIQAFKDIGKFLNDTFIQPVRDFIDNLSWDNIVTGATSAFTTLMEFVGGVFSTFFDLLPNLPPVFTIEFWTGLFTSIGETVVGWLVAVWDLVPDVPDVFTKQYWTDLFDFEMPSWGEIFDFALPDWLLTTVDFILGNGAFAGFSLSERLDFAFDLPDWLSTTIDFMTGDGVFAGFSIGDRIDLALGELPQPFAFIVDMFKGLFSIKLSDLLDFNLGFTNWRDILPDWSWSDIIPDSLSSFFSLENINSVFGSIGGAFSFALEPITNAINFIIDNLNDVLGWDPALIPGGTVGNILGIGLLDNISVPQLAKGGIVNKPTLAMIGEDGPEAVVPLSQRNNPSGAGMGGGTVNVTVNASGITDRTDKRALAREIGNMIQQEMARNIGGSTMRGRY